METVLENGVTAADVVIAYRYIGTASGCKFQCSFCGQTLWTRHWPIQNLLNDAYHDATLELLCSLLEHRCFAAHAA